MVGRRKGNITAVQESLDSALRALDSVFGMLPYMKEEAFTASLITVNETVYVFIVQLKEFSEMIDVVIEESPFTYKMHSWADQYEHKAVHDDWKELTKQITLPMVSNVDYKLQSLYVEIKKVAEARNYEYCGFVAKICLKLWERVMFMNDFIVHMDFMYEPLLRFIAHNIFSAEFLVPVTNYGEACEKIELDGRAKKGKRKATIE